jgi:8-oxo-dGTP diphosphatase
MTTGPVRVGVAVLIMDNEGRLAIGTRAGAHGAGTVSIPGGKVEFGETIE